MKKLLLMAFMALAMTANAQDKKEVSVDSHDVVTDDGGIQISKGKDDNDRWSLHVALGVNIPNKADGHSFAPFRSWEFNLTLLQYDYTPKNSKTTLSAGLGFNWRSYTLSGHDNCFAKVGDYVAVGNVNDEIINLSSGSVSVGGVPSKLNNLSSTVSTTAIAMPLLIKQRFSKSFAISVGAQLNWNFYGRIHNYFEVGDDDVDTYTKKIGQRPFTVDVLGILHFGKLGVYCKYSPMSVLKKDRGVEFKSFAAGIYF